MLDPYFRTIDGLAVLIEKDWCAFGHKFKDRCGQGEDHTASPDERSPVYIQLLDCIFQMLHQFPTTFEYNEDLLVFLADHVHSGLFGNFLGNNDRQRRKELSVYTSTRSLWSYISHNKGRFVNTSYVGFLLPIWPKYYLRNIQFWQRYYCRWDPECHPNQLSSQQWIDDW